MNFAILTIHINQVTLNWNVLARYKIDLTDLNSKDIFDATKHRFFNRCLNGMLQILILKVETSMSLLNTNYTRTLKKNRLQVY